MQRRMDVIFQNLPGSLKNQTYNKCILGHLRSNGKSVIITNCHTMCIVNFVPILLSNFDLEMSRTSADTLQHY